MKTWFVLLVLLTHFPAFSQRGSMVSETIPGNNAVPAFQKNYEYEVLSPGNWDQIAQYSLFRSEGWGYVSGNNNYGDLAKGQVFRVTEPYLIHAAYFFFGAVEGNAGQLVFRIWSFGNDGPGAVLASRTVPANQIVPTEDITLSHLVVFDPPLRVESDYMIGFELGSLEGTVVGLWSSDDGDGGGLDLAWERWGDGRWFPIRYGWELDIDLGIFPVIKREASSDESIEISQVSQRTDGSGLVDVFYSLPVQQQACLIALEFSSDGGTSYERVNPFFLSGDTWPVYPGNEKHIIWAAGESNPGISTRLARIKLTALSGLIVTTSPVSNLSPSSVTLGGSVLDDGGFAVTARGLAYADRPDPDLEDHVIPAGSGTGNFTATLEPLISGQTYYVRAFATNSRGTVYGNQVVFMPPADGPMLINGPGGSTITLPAEFRAFETGLSVMEYPASAVVREGQQSASVAMHILIDNQTFVGGWTDYEISIPVTLKNADPERLRLNVKVKGDVLLPVDGEYDQASGRYTVRTLGLAHDWVMGVVSGEPVEDMTDSNKEAAHQAAPADGTTSWPSIDFSIKDMSDTRPRPLTRAIVVNHLLPVANNSLAVLQAAGFPAPKLRRNAKNKYQMILIDREKLAGMGSASYYEPPDQLLLGRIFINYPPFMTDLTDNSTWRHKNVIFHEIFHSVQWGYEFEFLTKPAAFDNNKLWYGCSAYLEGTASLMGGTNEKRTPTTNGTVYVDSSFVFHDLGYAIDEFSATTPYNCQDFFAFLGVRYFSGNLTYLNGMFNSIKTFAPAKFDQPTLDYMLKFRKGLNHFLTGQSSSLPEAYTEYALQRLYLHEPDYLIRKHIKNANQCDDPEVNGWFTKSTLAVNLLYESKKYVEWKSKQNIALSYDEVKINEVRPLSAAVINMFLPPDLPASSRPDSISLVITLTGDAQLNQMMREEGMRILVVRATDELGFPVEKDATIIVTDVNKPLKISLAGGVKNLLFFIINAYVEEKPAGISIQPVLNNVYNSTQNVWYAKIQEAINASANGDQLVVYPGTHREYLSFKGKNITLRSAAGPGTTIIDGSHWNAFAVVTFESGESREAVLDGFTLLSSTYKLYRGVEIKNNSSPTVRNNVIQGLDVGVSVKGGSPLINKNTIKDNPRHGILAENSTSEIITNTISGSTEGGISLTDDSSTIKDNTIFGNHGQYHGGGIQIAGDYSFKVTIIGNTIHDNQSMMMGGGISSMGSKGVLTITNNTITNNFSGNQDKLSGLLDGSGGGISILSAAQIILKGNTITGNQADTGGGISIGNSCLDIDMSENTLSTNIAGSSGGGASISGGGIFSKNIITKNESKGSGGGLDVSAYLPVEISDNRIEENLAAGGGAGMVVSCDATIVRNQVKKNKAGGDGGGIFVTSGFTGSGPKINGNNISENQGERGGGVFLAGIPDGWERVEKVKVDGSDRYVLRLTPPFSEAKNTYSGNTHRQKTGSWGPGEDNWVEDAGYHVFIP